MNQDIYQFSFSCEIFNFHVLFSYDNDKDAALKYFKKMTKEPTLDLGDHQHHADGEGFCYSYQSFAMIRVPNNKRFTLDYLAKVVSHEAVHASYGIQDNMGQIFSEECQETQAYIVDFIVGHILKRLFPYHLKLQNKSNENRQARTIRQSL